MTALLSGISLYPVKSLGGIAVTEAELDEFGLRDDRRWMVVDAAGRFHTQRWRPRLALVRPELTGEGVRLRAPGMPEVLVPRGGGSTGGVAVWADICIAESCGADADMWISRFLGEACRIVYMPESTRRPIRRRREQALGRVGFADAYPFLLLSDASLAGLNARLDVPVPINRFRPNLVVSGVGAHAEDGWDRVRIGDVGFVVTKQCDRCVLTTIDQETAIGGVEPLRTLATYRKAKEGVMFGVYVAHAVRGRLSVGDVVVPTAVSAAV
jgi:uncharacterized protein YcbX